MRRDFCCAPWGNVDVNNFAPAILFSYCYLYIQLGKQEASFNGYLIGQSVVISLGYRSLNCRYKGECCVRFADVKDRNCFSASLDSRTHTLFWGCPLLPSSFFLFISSSLFNFFFFCHGGRNTTKQQLHSCRQKKKAASSHDNLGRHRARD